MARAKKETLIDEENNEVKYSALAEFEAAFSKKKTSVEKKARSAKKVATAKTSSSRTNDKKTTAVKKSTSRKKVSGTESSDKKATSTKRATTRKKVSDAKSADNKTTSAKKTATKQKVSSVQAKAEKSTTSKKSTAKSTSKKDSTSKEQPAKKISKTKASNKDSEELVSTAFDNIVEYYDLPYRYNQTVVKVLAQNPNTLFVYWDVSDYDIENFKTQYGENFLYITKPVLLVHNLTDNYSFEIDIDDFANNWYIHVEDAKCEYSVELCRRPNQSDKIENIITKEPTDFINISYSNTIEMPNDKILFFKDNQTIYFKNIKTNKVVKKKYHTAEHGKKLQEIYSNYNLAENEDRFDFKNPSSQNPTSNVM